MPSLAASDLQISRSGAHTRIRGGRSPPWRDRTDALELRGERLYGSFSLAVRVPDTYEKKWCAASLVDGVLRLRYRIDLDEVMIS